MGGAGGSITAGAAGSPEGGTSGSAVGGAGGSPDGGMSGSAGDSSGAGGDAGAAGASGAGGGEAGEGGNSGSAGAGSGGVAGLGGVAGVGGAAGLAGSGGSGTSGNGGSGTSGNGGAAGGGGGGCTGVPGVDCPCLRVTPDGDDAAAEASNGASPFQHVQRAIDFAAAHRDIAVDVCVGRASGSNGATIYSGVGDSDFMMRDGISVHGEGSFTILMTVTPAGVTFGPDVVRPTTLDGFWIEPLSTAVTVDRARNARISDVAISIGVSRDAPSAYHGVDARGATLELDAIRIVRGFTLGIAQDAVGVESFGSTVVLRNSTLRVDTSGTATGVWLEASPGSLIEDSHVNAFGNGGAVALRLVESDDVVLTGSTFDGGGGEGGAVRATDSADLLVEDCGITGRGGWQPGAQATSGLWLERCPGSLVQGGTFTCVGGSPGAAVRVSGDGHGVEIHDATVSASFGNGTIGVLLEDCGGASPLVSNNPSIVATNGGSVVAVRATGACHPIIESNGLISAEIPAGGGSATAVHCAAGSQCRIIDNPEIRARGVVRSNPNSVMGRGILCEGGACAEISKNHVVGLERIGEVACIQNCVFGPSAGIDLSQSSPLIERNTVEGGCGYLTTGIHSTQATSRVASNAIFGRSPSCDVEPPFSRGYVNYGLDIDGALDVHSNTVSAGGGSLSRTSCTGIAAFVRGASSLRNNVFSAASMCNDVWDVWANPSAPPTVIQNNAFAPPMLLAPGIYRNGENLMLEQVNALPGASGNVYLTGMGSTSSTIDAGTTVGLPTFDLDGNPRSQTLPDIGAVEWGDNPSLCTGVACSGHGECHADGTRPFCKCDSGYETPPGDASVCRPVAP